MDVLGNGKIQNSFRKLRYNSSMDERRGQGGKDVVTKVPGGPEAVNTVVTVYRE